MFWNTEFLDSSQSQIEILLQMNDVKLSDILFEEDLLQELKTYNVRLCNFLTKPDIISELVDNITQLTEKDCCDKSLYSQVHSAYVSCEILTIGSEEITGALVTQPESLRKILTFDSTKPPPQKLTLISKLINSIHSLGPENLSCFITKEMETFSKLIDTSIQNIDVSSSFDILSTFIKRTNPVEYRYVFCEVLRKLDFIKNLIDIMTLSEIEDKQRNACQLLCDIIVIGRQEASEQSDSNPVSQDMLSEALLSKDSLGSILEQMFSRDEPNSTAIICGLKLLQILIEKKNGIDQQKIDKLVDKTIDIVQGEIENHLIKFHELLIDPPKQEPIRTTFGVIQKPLGYLRFEVVNLIRALISTDCPRIINKLIELRTMCVIIDMFIEYSWNNLLHTQVEQCLCLIIRNCRRYEDHVPLDNKPEQQDKCPPSKALLSQLLNECDLISRLLMRDRTKRKQEEANFGHIIQMMNSLSINNDLEAIQEHLCEMKDKRPELYDRWTTFIDVDVICFKEISVFYDAHSSDNVTNHRFGNHLNHQDLNTSHQTKLTDNIESDPTTSHNNNNKSNNDNNDTSPNSDLSTIMAPDAVYGYQLPLEAGLIASIYPRINKDVIPRIRRPKNSHQQLD